LERLILETYGGYSTSSGVSVNSDTAMRLITVQNCVRVRAFTIAQLPCHVMMTDGRKKNPALDFYLYEKLHDQPNFWMTSFDFWGMAEAYVSLRGNFIAYKSMYGDELRELLPIPAGMVQQITQNPDYSIDYQIKFPNGDIKHLNNSQVMHLRGLTLNGYTGVNPIEYARECIGLGLASEKFLARFFGSGLHPGAVVEHPLTLNSPAYSSLKNNLKEKYAGLGNTHELMLIDEGMKIQFPQIKLVDAQFLEQMKMTEAQICGLFRVPLMLIQSGDKTPTYASAEQFMLSYSVYGVTPDCVNYEKSIRRDLLKPEERKKYFAKFNVNALLRGDFKTRMEGYQIGINSEIINPNEARDFEEWNPYDGGDEYRTRTSTVKEPPKSQGGETE
jgi:HK97 family phage portal protein